MSPSLLHIIFCANKKASVSSSIDYMAHAGYQVSFTQSEDALLKIMKKHTYCLVVIELDFNPKDAISLTNELKQLYPSAFIIVFTDKADDYVQITAFDNGADDFIIAPLKPILLFKRIQALTNRFVLPIVPTITPINAKFLIDKETYTILLKGKTYSLPRKEFEMLHLLSNHSHKAFSRHEISEKIWKEKLDDKSRIIDIHIRNIRKTLGEDIIQTIKGTGYVFNSSILK